MSMSDSAAQSAQPRAVPQDTQTLMTLLGSLVPLLLRMQPQTAPLYQPNAGAFLIGNPLLDHQAAVNLVEDMVGSSLRTLSAYLEANSAKHAALASCAPIVTQATHCLAARDYAQAFELIWQAYRLITALRAANPQLPALRSVEPGIGDSTQAAEAARVH
jgi:hypothetical protein